MCHLCSQVRVLAQAVEKAADVWPTQQALHQTWTGHDFLQQWLHAWHKNEEDKDRKWWEVMSQCNNIIKLSIDLKHRFIGFARQWFGHLVYCDFLPAVTVRWGFGSALGVAVSFLRGSVEWLQTGAAGLSCSGCERLTALCSLQITSSIMSGFLASSNTWKEKQEYI